MREIKFRAWKKTKYPEMFNDVAYVDWNNKRIGLNYPLSAETTRLDEDKLENFILMQSTGLKDKNGVEIFEGDIVQSTWIDVDNNLYNKKGEITYAGAQYVIAYDSQFDLETGEIEYDAHSLSYAENPEVIGNIYENSDLLEVAE